METAIMAKRKNNKSAPKLRSTDPVILELWVYAGGRCEFQGCPEYLLRDKLTTNTAKLADIAHIVARTIDGPRGDDPLPLSQRNKIDNLFLACTKHHRLIDKKSMVAKYPKDVLIQYKQSHEERIRFVTGLGDERETMVLRMMGNIRGNTVSISKEDIRKAVLGSSQRYPRYLNEKIISIGRSSTNTFALNDKSVSRRHCAIVNYNKDVWIYDLASTIGTFLEGERIVGKRFLLGVYNVQIGNVQLRIGSQADLLI